MTLSAKFIDWSSIAIAGVDMLDPEGEGQEGRPPWGPISAVWILGLGSKQETTEQSTQRNAWSPHNVISFFHKAVLSFCLVVVRRSRNATLDYIDGDSLN
jgi:hypothetical protein